MYNILVNNSKKYPDIKAFVGETDSFSYADVKIAVDEAAEHLISCGVSKGQPVILYLPNSPEFGICFFALMKIGAIVIPVDLRFENEILSIIEELQESFIITNRQYSLKITTIVKLHTNIFELGTIKMHTNDNPCLYFLPGTKKDKNINKYNKTALILYTSGTVGKPKKVELSESNLVNWALNNSETLQIRPGEAVGGFVPLFHSFGFGSCFLSSMYSAATLVFAENFIPRKVLSIIKEKNVNIFHGVPYMYDIFINTIGDSYNFPSVRCFISAGAKLNPNTAIKFYQKTGKVIHQEYGSTESCTVALNLEEDLELNIKSVGKPLSNVEIAIFDEEWNKVPAGCEGRIFIRSKAKAFSIANCQVSEITGINGEWFDMGDIGWKDNEGRIYITGRIKRVINVGGVKVYPEEIELLLMNHPNVEEAAVNGTKDSIYGEAIAAYVVAHCGKLDKLEEAELRKQLFDLCKKNLAPYKIPKYFIFTASLPKTSSGKIMYENISKLSI